MNANTFGSHFQISTFGESHGLAMGVVIEGCPAGVPFLWDLLHKKMEQRRPGRFAWMSDRKELDKPELLSGVFEGKTLGTPLALIVRNTNARPNDYQSIKYQPRIGHADDVWKQKFQHIDHRGGGRSSGRETVGRVMGGAVAEMFIQTQSPHLTVKAWPSEIGHFKRKDPPQKIGSWPETNWFGKQTQCVEKFLLQKKKEGFSYGGVITLEITNCPTGLGRPVFRKLKSDIASGLMSIGSCYEVSLGEFLEKTHLKTISQKMSRQEGSQFHQIKNSTVYGGIRGGISTGEPIIFHLKFKPPASIKNIAQTGRHDVCIVPRASVIVESMAWLILADHILWSRLDQCSL